MPLERFQHYQDLIDNFLSSVLPPDATVPEPIYRSMRYSLFAGGKRFRPVLCLAACESLGENAQRMLPVAAAIEMIHTYSLIHDDLPAMDDDDFRRGKPTNHKVFGEAIAILAGDALLTAAIEMLSRSEYDHDVRTRLIELLTQAVGTSGMIGGQVIDMVSEARKLNRIELEQLHSMKTAALIRFSSSASAVVLRAGQTIEEAFANYGESIGLAFQIVDDILDIEGITEVLGKTVGKDAKRMKVTYPSLIGIEESKQLASNLVETACARILPYDRYSYLRAIALNVLEREK
jgi:geranylgeranyl diphosphate synthase, type II